MLFRRIFSHAGVLFFSVFSSLAHLDGAFWGSVFFPLFFGDKIQRKWLSAGVAAPSGPEGPAEDGYFIILGRFRQVIGTMAVFGQGCAEKGGETGSFRNP